MSPKSFGPTLISRSLAALAAAILLVAPAEAQIQKAIKTRLQQQHGPRCALRMANRTCREFGPTPLSHPSNGRLSLPERQPLRSKRWRRSKRRQAKTVWTARPNRATQAVTIRPGSIVERRGCPPGKCSLVVDPPNGKVPVKPSAEAQRDYDLAHIADSYEHQTTWERCITRGIPAGYVSRRL